MAKKSKTPRKSGWSRVIDWLTAAPGVIIAALSPWYDRVFAFPIISEYWQPELRTTATGIAGIAFIVGYVRYRGSERDPLQRVIARAAFVGAVTFIVCLACWMTTGFWNPGVPAVYALWFAWILAYITVFACIAVVLAGVTLLIGPNGPE